MLPSSECQTTCDPVMQLVYLCQRLFKIKLSASVVLGSDPSVCCNLSLKNFVRVYNKKFLPNLYNFPGLYVVCQPYIYIYIYIARACLKVSGHPKNSIIPNILAQIHDLYHRLNEEVITICINICIVTLVSNLSVFGDGLSITSAG